VPEEPLPLYLEREKEGEVKAQQNYGTMKGLRRNGSLIGVTDAGTKKVKSEIASFLTMTVMSNE